MHAGDAIWYLYAGLRLIERQHANESSTLKLVNHLRSSVKTLGEHCGVPEPSEDDYTKLSVALENFDDNGDDLSMEADVEYATDQLPRKTSRGKYSDPSTVEAAVQFVDEMVNSGCFDWADFVCMIQEQLGRDSPFITSKQFKALKNIAVRGKVDVGEDEDESWWDLFEDEHPEVAKIVLEQSELA
ncbi:hypothetical protein LCGC14_0898130 [marine sediment metagenome]|uniref:Uncharacterized protein n=1 Tax=marine sediment metagenome TaxID=412755 RepID=A0A0F9P233_9ZZZZ